MRIVVERVGALVVSYGARCCCIADTLKRSSEYDVDLYVVDRQRNPMNMKLAKEHVVVPDLRVDLIVRFVKHRKEELDFVFPGPEGPIVEGLRDEVEGRLGVPVISPTKAYAFEASKIEQRELLAEYCPKANPRYKVFDPAEQSLGKAKEELWDWLDELEDRAVVKPDKPGFGKGVGVWGDHFTDRKQLYEHFASIFESGQRVIVEEKLEGEESSFQAFCDGKSLGVLPETRDYKRAFEGDRGPNTGGMGSYKHRKLYLPFMTKEDYEAEIEIVTRIIKQLKKEHEDARQGLRGMPFYVAFMHTAEGKKILEINSRPGDPEIMCVLPLLKQDFVDVCFGIVDGSLGRLEFEKKASVAIYKAPPSYGEFEKHFPQEVDETEVGTPVRLAGALGLKGYGESLLVYPGSLELREDGNCYALSSRAVACVGIGETIEEAREEALRGIEAIEGGGLWYRKDIASKEHVQRSVERMRRLRLEAAKRRIKG